MSNFIDMTGWIMAEHGIPDSRLTVIEYMGNQKWLCKCNCNENTEVIVKSRDIRKGRKKIMWLSATRENVASK